MSSCPPEAVRACQRGTVLSGWIRRPRSDTNYRADIDGVRAVAIIGVVGFHVGLPGFAGGFVGVDIFFVISGFLITTLLLNELRHRGSIDLLTFFARRARRLLPAFFLVLATTLLLGFFFLVPVDGEQRGLADSAVAAALYVSNWHFTWVGGGYFDAPSNLYPLLHTWSLAVEEQFYLIWPLMLLGASWAALRWRFTLPQLVAAILVAVILASSSFTWWAAESGEQAARLAFFALASRAWELGIGAALALALPALRQSHSWFGTFLTAAGLIAIVAAITTFRDGIAFPGAAALVPTLGTAAVIAGGWLAPQAPVMQLLSLRPLVTIGLLSYSWYLWHWPLLAIARAHELGGEDLWRDGAIAIVALGLAGLTYVLIEHPVRSRKIFCSWSSRRTLGAGAVASLMLILAAQLLSANASRLAKTEAFARLDTALNDKGWSGERCYRNSDVPFGGLIPASQCTQTTQPGQKILVTWGDSHADHLIGMLETADTGRQYALLSRPQGLCPPLIGVVPRKAKQPFAACARFNREVLAEIYKLHQEGRLAAVVLSAHWSLYLGDRKLAGGSGVRLRRDGDGRWLRGHAAADAMTDGLRSTLRALTTRGIRALVVAPMPEQRFRVPACLARHSLEFCSVSRSLAEDHRNMALAAVRKAMDGSIGAYLWDPLPALCGEEFCLAERDGVVMYRDGDHLTYAGSRWLGASFARSRAWTELFSLHLSADETGTEKRSTN